MHNLPFTGEGKDFGFSIRRVGRPLDITLMMIHRMMKESLNA